MDPKPSASTDIPTIHTYHCICHTLILATSHALSSLPTRATSKDGARILAPTSQAQVVHTIEESKPIIIRREDGFERRTLVRCERCRLVVGYKLDGDHFDDSSKEAGAETLYVLPGALVDTAGMMADKTAEVPAWAREVG
jgi:hypothetical protein